MLQQHNTSLLHCYWMLVTKPRPSENQSPHSQREAGLPGGKKYID